MLILLAALLLGCESGTPAPPAPTAAPVAEPPARRVPTPPARSARPLPDPSRAESAALRAYYTRVETDLRVRGLLRTDRGGPDTPFDADRLAATFMRLAFFEEYDLSDGRFISRERASMLHRFAGPVRIETRFGDSVPIPQRAIDRANVADFAHRLGRVTNHSVGTAARGGNFIVYFVGEGERRALGADLRRIVPGLSSAALRTITDLPRTSYCLVFAIDPGGTGTYSRAIAIIRAEHPDLLRLSCIHEEMSQGLGLKNDSAVARPSIFNDDEEFALLTRHDELLLKILYDPRLRPGMRAPEAEPIVRRIAHELLADA